MTPSEQHYEEPTVQTSSGLYFNAYKPEFRLTDIAHALSQICRFNGHTSRFYSVAQHSLLVADIMRSTRNGDAREGLLHDAAEAYLGDIASPIKAQLPDYRAFEEALDRKLRDHFGLPLLKTDACKRADWIALFIEAHHLLPDGGLGFADPFTLREHAVALDRTYGFFKRAIHTRDPELDFKIAFYEFEEMAA